MATEKPAAQTQIVFTLLFSRYSYAEMPYEPGVIELSVGGCETGERRGESCALDASILCGEI